MSAQARYTGRSAPSTREQASRQTTHSPVCCRRGVAPREAIDAAMRLGANHPVGPLALGDLIGLDVVKSIMETLSTDCSGKYDLSPLIREMVEKGLLGKKSGEGFYRYPGRKGR